MNGQRKDQQGKNVRVPEGTHARLLEVSRSHEMKISEVVDLLLSVALEDVAEGRLVMRRAQFQRREEAAA